MGIVMMVIALSLTIVHPLTCLALVFVLVVWFWWEIQAMVGAMHLNTLVIAEVVIVTLGGSLAVWMRFESLRVFLATLLAVVATDTFASVGGKLFGRRVIARGFSRYSPSKSWEGAAIGLVAGAAVFALVLWGDWVGWWFGLALGAGVATIAILGDLLQSAMKRSMLLKDTASSLGAHGGISERADSQTAGFILVAVVWFATAWAPALV